MCMVDCRTIADSNIVYRHPLAVRLWHWCTAAAVGGLLLTGFCILNVHPRLYWGEIGNAATQPIMALVSTAAGGPRATTHPVPAALTVGSHRWDVTGYLGGVWDLGADGIYFVIALTPDSWQFGAMRAWHFACAWTLIIAWICYAAYLPASGRLRRTLLPTARQVTVRSIGQDLWNHLRLRRAKGEEARHYNLLQKVSYLVVLFVLIPGAVLSGITMSNSITARFPELYTLLGGRQSARTIHALCAAGLLFFSVVHFAQLFVAGFINEVRSMITGYFSIRTEAPK